MIQYLRDKKANKGKENVNAAKGVKHNRQDSKDGKQSPVVDKKTPVKALTTTAPSPDQRSPQAIKVEKAAREVVRVLNKQAVNNNKGVAAAPLPAPPPAATPLISASPSPLADKKRERGSASAAARILQRDLGLGVNPGGRGGRRGVPGVPGRVPANNAPSAIKQDTGSTSQTSKEPGAGAIVAPANETVNAPPPITTPNNSKAQAPIQTPTGPSAVRAPPRPSSSPATTNIALNSGFVPTKATPVPSTATQAFLKHANPSQGITEPLLGEAFAGFGTIKKVEIDKKKGFAYIEFAEPQGLHNAIKASPVKVAQGQVVVLERKTGPSLQARNMRGGSPMMGNRGGAPMTRGGRAPMVPRGGRGGSMRRGGGPGTPGRGAAPFPNANAPKAPTAAASSSNQEAASADPLVASMADEPPDTGSTSGSANVTASTLSTTSQAVSAAPPEHQGT